VTDAMMAPLGAGLRTKIGVPAGWFRGTHVEMVEQVAAHGFTAFEALGAVEWEEKDAVRAKCEELGVSVSAVRGGGTIVKDGPVNPDYHATFEEQLRTNIEHALALGAKKVVGLAGQFREGVAKEVQMDALVQAGKRVSPMLEDAGIMLVWEPLNVKVNHGGYALVTSDDAADVVRRTGSPNVKILFDVYHQQISEGDVSRNIQAYINEIGHFHFGDNPGRHEPGTGELNYTMIFKAIYEAGYRDIVAAELAKTMDTEDALRAIASCARW